MKMCVYLASLPLIPVPRTSDENITSGKPKTQPHEAPQSMLLAMLDACWQGMRFKAMSDRFQPRPDYHIYSQLFEIVFLTDSSMHRHVMDCSTSTVHIPFCQSLWPLG